MALLRQIATRNNDGTEIPSSEPTGAAYVKFKAKYYLSLLPGTKTRGSRLKIYGQKQMAEYKKILKREGKFPIS